jgi:plasmid stability protein
MANLTIVVDDDILRRARVRATERGTSVNAVLAEHLAQYAGPDAAASALAEFLELAEAAGAGSGPGGRTWIRDELYDRPRLR